MPPHEVVEDVGHGEHSGPGPAHHEDLHQLTSLLEILAQHQHEAVLGHGDARGHDEAVADVDLVELRGEGSEETAQRYDQAAHHGCQADGLFLRKKEIITDLGMNIRCCIF